MENVIKQGYLKKSNSTEGGMFSGILEKMTPRKWYMLVVRNRVPYLEQYDRDVDVYSSNPSHAYNLSVCTSISRTMSTTARTFLFVIVLPDELIELIAANRDQMVDWCNALERTLKSLGILSDEKEEHIYTFCPAVVNLVGRSRKSEVEEEERSTDEELGAVGGMPFNPPPRHHGPGPSAIPPVPLPRMMSEPAQSNYNLSPPPLPGSHPPPLPEGRDRSASPFGRIGNAGVSSAPPSPHVSVPLPVGKSSAPPPLPPARPGHSTGPARPPPLLPARPTPSGGGAPERSLPPVPPIPSAPTAPSPSRGVKHLANASDSEEEDSSDYSSDFVSGAFWEINRKIPVPTARHAKLPLKPNDHVTASGASNGKAVSKEASANGGDLDEGYSDLSTLNIVKESEPETHGTSDKYEYSKVNKKSAGKPGLTSDSDEAELKNKVGSTNLIDLESDSEGADQMTSSPCAENASEVSTPGSAPDTDRNTDNFYAPFPGVGGEVSEKEAVKQGNEDDSSDCSSDENDSDHDYDNNISDDDTEVEISVAKIVSSTNKEHSSSELPPLPTQDLESDCMYGSVAEASSLFATPPLPPRQESLLTEKEGTADDVFVNHNGAEAAFASSEALAMSHRPIPRRRTVHPASAFVSHSQWNGILGSDLMTRSLNSDIPPLPPPRKGGGMARVESLDSAVQPPPLPARKTQSFRSQRSSAAMSMSLTVDLPETDAACSLLRKQSFGSSDASAAENDLRQRMRLDRVHSVHSVVSLKQSQAEILQQEMDLPGVTVTVTQKASQGIALVDCADAVCVVGWNQKDFPSLHGKFHIGDQLISICNVKVTSAAMAHKMLKHPSVDLVEMLVKRMPHAKVMAIRRSAEGQSIGIKRNGGTAEIQYVDPHGLAADNGLPLHAPSILGAATRSSWFLTEINNRPLNLFFKEFEIEHRLNAVGKEITIVVQPTDYITELKKQLKKLKNHKCYIVQ